MDILNELKGDILESGDTLRRVLLALLAIAVAWRLILLAKQLADRNQTIGKPKSGHIMIVKVGELVTKFIMPGVEGKRIDPKTGKVSDGIESRGFADEFFLAEWVLNITGWYWLGLFAIARWTTLRHKEFLSVEEEDGQLSVKLLECDLEVEQIPFRKAYALIVPRAETKKSRFDIDILVLVTFEVTNAKTAYVEIEDASLNSLSTTQSGIRGWTAKKENQALLETQSEAGNAEIEDSLLSSLLELNDGPTGISERYGLKISDIDIRQIRLPKDIREALQKYGMALENRKATLIDADADAKAKLKKGLAEAQILTAKVQALNGNEQSLERISMADAVKEAQPDMLSFGSQGIYPSADRANFRRRQRGNDGKKHRVQHAGQRQQQPPTQSSGK